MPPGDPLPAVAGTRVPFLRRRRPRRLGIAIVPTPVVIALLGFLVAPPIARRVAQTKLAELLGRRVSIEKVRVNPFALSLAVEGFAVYEADGSTPFVSFARLYVNVE